MKSLSQIMRRNENLVGNTHNSVVAHQKRVQNPATGKEFSVPGHVLDFTEQNAVTKTRHNADRYASHEWNWRRRRILKHKLKDVNFAAVEHPKTREYKIDSE